MLEGMPSSLSPFLSLSLGHSLRQPNEKGLNALEFAASEPRMHTADPAHPEQVLRLLVRTGARCQLWRVGATVGGGAGEGVLVEPPQPRLVMLRWLRVPRPPWGMDSPAMTLDAALAMNDRLVREYLFQRRKWLLCARERLRSGDAGLPVRGSAGAGAAAGRDCDVTRATEAPSSAVASPDQSAAGLVLGAVRRGSASGDVALAASSDAAGRCRREMMDLD